MTRLHHAALGALGALLLILLPPIPGSALALASERAVFATPAAIGALAGTWSWPTGGPVDVLRRFDLPHPYAAGHRGIDLATSAGSPVLSPDDGVVHFAGVVVDRPVLSVRHQSGLISSFEPVEASVAAGDAVRRGEVIGTVSVAVTHAPNGGLHLGARLDGAYVDPLALLGAIPKAVLLPLG